MLAGNAPYFPEFESDDFLEEVVLTSSAASVTFSGLDAYSDYKHLQVRFTARSDRSGATQDAFYGYFNSDFNTSNYRTHNLFGNGSSVSSLTLANIGQWAILPGATETTNTFTGGIVDILDFSDTSKNTTIRSFEGKAGASAPRINLWSNLWISTNAVTSIWLQPFGGNLIAGSRFSLYGSKG